MLHFTGCAIVLASLRLFPLLPIKGCVGMLLQGLADGFVGRLRLGSRRPERHSGLFVDSCNTSKDPSKILHHVKKKKKVVFFKILTNLVSQLQT